MDASQLSADHRDLLDIIDKIRSQGISRYVDLPEILVCGDQSCGKSSVLEGLSRMPFPTKDALCTRHPTELILRRDDKASCNVSIIPGNTLDEKEKARLRQFSPGSMSTDLKMGQLGVLLDAAMKAMGLDGTKSSKVFSTSVLRVELSGPSLPNLTLVDLPGLFKAGNKDQSEQDAKVVNHMVLEYMARPRSIILAVVSAKSEFALQEITTHARKLDPDGIRTLGIITKPDTLILARIVNVHIWSFLRTKM